MIVDTDGNDCLTANFAIGSVTQSRQWDIQVNKCVIPDHIYIYIYIILHNDIS